MTKDQFDEFKTDIAEIKKKYNVNDSDVSRAFRQVIKDTEHERIIQKAKENKKYVGKYYVHRVEREMFPEMNRYYKIISYQSSNEYHVEALAFDEHPIYFFDYHSPILGETGDNFLGNFDFEGFEVEDVFVQTLINSSKEISEEEYWEAADRYLAELKKIPWTADHYRYGGKLPTDPGWVSEGVKKDMN